MIIFDGTHLTSTESELDLHRFAVKIGLKRKWYQNHQKHPHYDIIGWYYRRKIRKCVDDVVWVTPIQLLKASWWSDNKRRLIVHRGGGRTFVDLLPE